MAWNSKVWSRTHHLVKWLSILHSKTGSTNSDLPQKPTYPSLKYLSSSAVDPRRQFSNSSTIRQLSPVLRLSKTRTLSLWWHSNRTFAWKEYNVEFQFDIHHSWFQQEKLRKVKVSQVDMLIRLQFPPTNFSTSFAFLLVVPLIFSFLFFFLGTKRRKWTYKTKPPPCCRTYF